MKRFKVGDKVVICPSSQFYHQQEFDDNNNPKPLTITKVNCSGYHYNTNRSRLYDDKDLLPFSDEPQYEIY